MNTFQISTAQINLPRLFCRCIVTFAANSVFQCLSTSSCDYCLARKHCLSYTQCTAVLESWTQGIAIVFWIVYVARNSFSVLISWYLVFLLYWGKMIQTGKFLPCPSQKLKNYFDSRKHTLQMVDRLAIATTCTNDSHHVKLLWKRTSHSATRSSILCDRHHQTPNCQVVRTNRPQKNCNYRKILNVMHNLAGIPLIIRQNRASNARNLSFLLK